MGRSCLSHLLEQYDLILDVLYNQANADVVYLDFSKAFDKVDHIIALKKIKSHKKLYLVFNREVSLIPLFLLSSSAILTKKLSIQKSPSGSINEVKQVFICQVIAHLQNKLLQQCLIKQNHKYPGYLLFKFRDNTYSLLLMHNLTCSAAGPLPFQDHHNRRGELNNQLKESTSNNTTSNHK